MRIAVIADAGSRDQAEKLAGALASEGEDAELLEPPTGGEVATIAGLASALLAFEAKLATERPDAVALVGGRDEPLAAAIVAAKLEIPAYRVGAGEAGYGRIVGMLAERTVAASAAEAAREIAAAS